MYRRKVVESALEVLNVRCLGDFREYGNMFGRRVKHLSLAGRNSG